MPQNDIGNIWASVLQVSSAVGIREAEGRVGVGGLRIGGRFKVSISKRLGFKSEALPGGPCDLEPTYTSASFHIHRSPKWP